MHVYIAVFYEDENGKHQIMKNNYDETQVFFNECNVHTITMLNNSHKNIR